MSNCSTVTEFLLMGFSEEREVQLLHFVMFLFIYIIALMGNVLMATVVALDHHLHIPMYFFLVNMSLSDICYISTVIPKSMATLLAGNEQISFHGCVAQVFLVITFAGTELFMLTVMAYDRYVAISNPLQYSLILNWGSCIKMATASWICSIIDALLLTTITFRLTFCGINKIEQFFCDIPQLLKISYSNTKMNQIVMWINIIIVDSFCIGFIFTSYGYIFSAVLKIPSDQARHKVFSTCIPHVTIFSLFIFTAIFSYMRPKSLSSHTIDLLSAFLYAVLPPLLNPIIYSLRNKDIQGAVRKIVPRIKRNLL